jgi:hypothetical protein
MYNKTKTTRVAATGLAGLAVGMVATIALVSELAADTPDSTAVERQESAPAQQYTGPRMADAVAHWLRSPASDTGLRTASFAPCWFVFGSTYTGPTTPDAAAQWLASC